MLRDSPSQEPKSERVILIDIVDQHGTKQIQATILRRAMADEVDANGRMIYNDGKLVTGLRNATWSSDKANAYFTEDLMLFAYLRNPADGLSTVYSDVSSHSLGYRNTYFVDSRDAEVMYKSLTKINRALAKIAGEFGGLESNQFAQWVIRLAKVLNITTFVTYDKRRNDLSDSTYCYHGAQFLTDVVDHMVKKELNK